MYGFSIGIFGLVSIVTLSAIAVERLIVIQSPLSNLSRWRITRGIAHKIIIGIWIYCTILSAPPLFGWSTYVPEGVLTSCSWDYVTRSTSNRAYYIYLLTGGFIVPFSLIVICYVRILIVLLKYVGVTLNKQDDGLPLMKRNDVRTAQMIFMLIVLFVVSWTPYALVSLLAQFGDLSVVTPRVATIPALFAKAAVVYNPLVYGMRLPHFRSSIRHLFSNASSYSQIRKYRNSILFRKSVAINSNVRLKDEDREDRQGDGRENNLYYLREEGVCTIEPLSPHVVQWKTEGRTENRIMMRSNMSEPNLMRMDDKVIPAKAISNVDYRREKQRFLLSTLFCSESSLIRYSLRSTNCRQLVCTEKENDEKLFTRQSSHYSCISKFKQDIETEFHSCSSGSYQNDTSPEDHFGPQASYWRPNSHHTPAVGECSRRPSAIENNPEKYSNYRSNCCDCASSGTFQISSAVASVKYKRLCSVNAGLGRQTNDCV